MTQEEMRKEYHALYEMMANSNNVAFMHTFGQVQKEVMEWAIANKPELAQEWLEKLETIKWKNYLTPKEAEKIVNEMVPKAPWSMDTWKQAMTQLGIPVKEEPHYNACALWVVMNQVYTDHAQTIAEKIIKKPLGDIPTEQIIRGTHALAVDLLKDRDGRYNVRTYFGL